MHWSARRVCMGCDARRKSDSEAGHRGRAPGGDKAEQPLGADGPWDGISEGHEVSPPPDFTLDSQQQAFPPAGF